MRPLGTPAIGDYVLGIWFLGWPGHEWLLVVMKSADGQLVATSRFRHPGRVSLVGFVGPAETDATAIDRVRRMVSETTSQLLGSRGASLADPSVIFDEVLVCGDSSKARTALRHRPWITADVLPPEGAN